MRTPARSKTWKKTTARLAQWLGLAMCLLSTAAAAGPFDLPEDAEPPARAANSIAAPAPCLPPESAKTLCQAPDCPWPQAWWHWWNPACGRGQHYAYCPPCPGWYYFHPYSVGQLRAQQAAAASWGGDTRDPYSHAIFHQVYRENPTLIPAKESVEPKASSGERRLSDSWRTVFTSPAAGKSPPSP